MNHTVPPDVQQDPSLAAWERRNEAAQAEAERQDRLQRDPEWHLKAALWYARHGWPVFPLPPACKEPFSVDRYPCDKPCAGTHYHGFKDATTDANRIRMWWDYHPRANIGCPAGIHWDVIDIDGPKHRPPAPGYQNLTAMQDAGDDPYDGALAVSYTGTGGRHIFVPTSPSHKNGQDLLPGINVKTRGGYVVLPPSKGELGRRYAWIQEPVWGAR